MYDILSIGDCVLDTLLLIDKAQIRYGKKGHRPEALCLSYADKIAIAKAVQSLGGNAANFAVGAKKLGTKVAIMSQIGEDINGRMIQEGLKKKNVDTTYLTLGRNLQTRYSIVLNYDTERTVLSNHPKHRYIFPEMPQTKWVYYTSLGEGFERLQKKLRSWIHKHPNVHLAMNPGSYMLKHGVVAIKEILQDLDVLFVNKEEAEHILQIKAPVQTLLKKFWSLGVDIPVITDGARGSYAYQNGEYFFMPIFPVKPIAKTGAGDAFAAGFISALIFKKEVKEALEWGTANAAGVIQKFGAQEGILNKKDIQKLLKKYPKQRAIRM
ncbi:MAG: hypothetical protein COV59_04670 [Candidatus Magasanikbacteria bacterium CG11_big_fil_rev_8_21_14_0_20_39_34]|uniref:Carbohydrate kinase PfkB domain-containing protein n=1 Tax=Candidatus Magasanikbacteria bacterium CG11_big_fil_rev_8_21_14_0_20_39_34 TaxID=1974653 RepID=A0A2H0N6J1_9BACT|nr:MAG: hypothetical protein COV59_04670 [Candidatus Magasanikbacteria bacterium CG11_big_fil_rev_8_21_14_0_20_39_34]